MCHLLKRLDNHLKELSRQVEGLVIADQSVTQGKRSQSKTGSDLGIGPITVSVILASASALK